MKRTTEQERLRKARRRKRQADQEWEKVTGHWLARVTVVHSIWLRDFLIKVGLLDPENAENQAAIERAVEALLEGGGYVPAERERQGCEVFDCHWRRSDKPGELNIRMTPEVVELLVQYLFRKQNDYRSNLTSEFAEHFREDRLALKTAIEEWLFLQYRGYLSDPVVDSYGILWGSWNYQRGGSEPPPARKPEPDPTW